MSFGGGRISKASLHAFVHGRKTAEPRRGKAVVYRAFREKRDWTEEAEGQHGHHTKDVLTKATNGQLIMRLMRELNLHAFIFIFIYSICINVSSSSQSARIYLHLNLFFWPHTCGSEH